MHAPRGSVFACDGYGTAAPTRGLHARYVAFTLANVVWWRLGHMRDLYIGSAEQYARVVAVLDDHAPHGVRLPAAEDIVIPRGARAASHATSGFDVP